MYEEDPNDVFDTNGKIVCDFTAVAPTASNILVASQALVRTPGFPLAMIGAGIIHGLRSKVSALELAMGPWATRLMVAPFTLGFVGASRGFHAGIARDPTYANTSMPPGATGRSLRGCLVSGGSLGFGCGCGCLCRRR